MFRRLLAGLGIALTIATTTSAQITIDFEDFSLAPQSYLNASPLNGGFMSHGVRLANNFHSTYRSWRGWSISNVVNTQTPGVGNQYASFPGGGVGIGGNPGDEGVLSELPVGGGSHYGVAFIGGNAHVPTLSMNIAQIDLPLGFEPASMSVANTTYAARSMMSGDQFAKRFGGPSGNDPDFFELRVYGLDSGGEIVSIVSTPLADYRARGSADDFIQANWQYLDLSPLQGLGVRALGFGLISSDLGDWGLNTPAYFAMDNLRLEPTSSTPPEVVGGAAGDGVVNRADIATLVRNFGRSLSGQTAASALASGDFNDDGLVSLADVSLLQSNLSVVPSGSPTAVPEPSTLVMCGLAFLSAFAVRRRR